MLKRRRLPNGKWITQKLPESSAEDLDNAKPDQIWEAGDGRRILPKDMETKHLVNVINLLRERTKMRVGFTTDILCRDMHPIFKHLVSELERRAIGQAEEPTRRKITLED